MRFYHFCFCLAQIPNVLSPITNEPNAPQSMCLIQQTGISPEQLSVISRFAMASVGSQGTVGGLVVAGLVSKNWSYCKLMHSQISHAFLMKIDFFFPFALVTENGWMACIGWCWCTLWLYLLLRTPVME